jgi:amino acid permease
VTILDRAKESGLIVELILIALGGIISCTSMHILSWGASDLQCSSYSELIQMSLGNGMKRLFEVLTICYSLLGCT